MPVLVAQLEHGPAVVASDRVQEDLGGADDADRLLDSGAARLRRRDVEHERGELSPGILGGAGDRLELLLVAVDRDDARSLRGEGDGAGTAETAGSDHEHRTSREPQPVGHVSPWILAS